VRPALLRDWPATRRVPRLARPPLRVQAPEPPPLLGLLRVLALVQTPVQTTEPLLVPAPPRILAPGRAPDHDRVLRRVLVLPLVPAT
jgi:hypothetical protein